MAFGFFKKQTYADSIFYNGHIFTHDPDFPWADAVACADGKIIAVGEYDAMSDLTGGETNLIDLEGKFLFPGFIDVHRSPVLKVFENKYLDLSGCSDTDSVLGLLSDWVSGHPDDEIIFGYGCKEDFAPPEGALNEICNDKPVVLLGESGIDCTINTVAADIVKETAEEECVEIVTVRYILNLLIPFNFEEIEEAVVAQIDDLCDKGITSVLNLHTPDYFETFYQDSLIAFYNEGKIKQRFFGAYLLNRPLDPRGLIHRLMARRTGCTEISGLINADTLNLYLDEKNCPIDFSPEALCDILADVSERNFNIFIEAINYEDLLKAYGAVEFLRNKGYKNQITIASDLAISEEEKLSLENWETVTLTWGSDVFAAHPVASSVSSISDAIDELTVKAAAILNMSDKLGTIEKGKLADFTIFDQNPLDCDLRTFSKLHAAMTVLDGRIVYDAEGDMMTEMYDMFVSQQF